MTMQDQFYLSCKKFVEEVEESTGGEWGVYLNDLNSCKKLTINCKKVFSSASLIKLPILVSVLIAVDEKIFDWDYRLDISDLTTTKKIGSGILAHLKKPISMTIEDLCYLMIVVSDNYATDYLIDFLGFNYINDTFKKIGLLYTSLNQKLVPFDKLLGRNPITPEDTGILLENIYYRRYPQSEKAEHILQQQIYNARLPLLLPYEEIEDNKILIAHKTGTLKTIAHDVGIFRTPTKDYILCILTQDQKSISNTNMAIAELSNNIYKFMSTSKN